MKTETTETVLESPEHQVLVLDCLEACGAFVPLLDITGMDRLDVRALTEAIIGEEWESNLP